MSEKIVIGREKETKTINELVASNQSELAIVLGRRRVGKTYLVKNVLKNQLDFHFTGIKNTDKESMLNEFGLKIHELSNGKLNLSIPKTWLEGFRLLRFYLESIKSKKKKVVFIDEFPWLDTHKSGFLSAFEYFWNDWAVNQNIVIVICGSSTSWMLNNVVNNKAGLHNRITKYINLQPFTLAETQKLFVSMGIKLPHYEIIQLYMALGGIPYYLKEVRAGESAIQNIDNLLFNENSTLKNEFQNLYRALFDNYGKYETIVKALSKKQKGLTREEILTETGFTNGGSTTRMLTELEESSFVKTYLPFGKTKKETLYRLVDEYSIFYLQFGSSKNKQESFMQISQTNKYKIWTGFAFESLCMKHIHKIKEALGISGIFTNENSFYYKQDNEGFQIDLLIDRADNAINICEAKFYATEYELTKKEAQILRHRQEMFRQKTKTKKYLITTLLTTFGLKKTENSIGLVDKVITMDQLF